MPRLERERTTLVTMIAMYCRDQHASGEELCEACRELQEYALARLDRCRYGVEKPKCSACATHCYKPAMQERVRAVMRHAGPRMLWRHPVLAAGHIVDGLKHPPAGKRSCGGKR